MSICMSHKSADAMLEMLSQSGCAYESVSASNLRAFSANMDEIEEAIGVYSTSELPIQLLVGHHNDRRSNVLADTHTVSFNLPDGAIMRVDEGIYTVSPELCLLQQASELHIINLCQMLGRFMATKASSYKNESDLVDRRPLVSVHALEDFMRAVPHARGIGALREALRWTAPAAASPQETNLQLALTLPGYYGGFSLAMPAMNRRVKLKGVAAKLLKGHRFFHPDLSWPDFKVGCEYQGSKHKEQLQEDCSRALAADAMGYELWYLTSEQLYSADHMDYIARKIAARIGKRINEKTWPSLERLDWLLSVLKGRVVPKPGERFAVRKSRKH